MMIYSSNWSFEDKDKLCSQEWKIGDNDEWYREELYCSPLKQDDWTCDTLIEAINKDIEDGLSVLEILTKYLEECDYEE